MTVFCVLRTQSLFPTIMSTVSLVILVVVSTQTEETESSWLPRYVTLVCLQCVRHPNEVSTP